MDEDGRLVCRTRHAGRDSCVFNFYLRGDFTDAQTFTSRPKPYDRPARPLAFVTPNEQDAHTASQDRTLGTNIDGPTLSRLFQNLAPLFKESSSGSDSKATAICASLGLDPATSEDIVSLFKKQFVTNGHQESRYVGETPSVTFNR